MQSPRSELLRTSAACSSTVIGYVLCAIAGCWGQTSDQDGTPVLSGTHVGNSVGGMQDGRSREASEEPRGGTPEESGKMSHEGRGTGRRERQAAASTTLRSCED